MSTNKDQEDFTKEINKMASKKKAKKKTTTNFGEMSAIQKARPEVKAALKAAKKKAKKKVVKKKTQKKKVVKKKAKKKAKKKIENNQSAGKRVNNGGARKNAGRKEGSTTKKTRAIADKLAESDEITPLEYMLGVLRETPEKLKAKFDKGEIDSAQYVVELEAMQKRKDNAAEKAAPYIHPRLSSIEAKVSDGTHERWLALMAGMEKDKQ